MDEIIVSSFSDKDERKVDEYHDESDSSANSSESSGSETKVVRVVVVRLTPQTSNTHLEFP